MEFVGFFKLRDEKFLYIDLDGEGEWGGMLKKLIGKWGLSILLI